MSHTFLCISLLIKIKTHYKERYVCDAQESKFRRVNQFLQIFWEVITIYGNLKLSWLNPHV